ncbi:hypothetical protein [Pontibacter ramchanderi]|uniref:Uncharacterized protein n=1 Tax=Pontibacter ramchanderi TaxID=1179743 RepID=A0A2N3V287_9BACT|nr:hypothetical protein [Pontibacter ramchanderi]PKV75745.1 hypothetical protein BD749_0691 [Pontibacter ramchanderi]
MQQTEHWDEDRYQELNTYFKVKIQHMLDSDPYIRDLQGQKNGLQLSDLIDRMSEREQELWSEFIRLDRIKLHRDMQNHLEGKGTPYSPQKGFGGSTDDGPSLW